MNELEKLKIFHAAVKRGLNYKEATSFVGLCQLKNITSEHETFTSVLDKEFTEVELQEQYEADRLDDLEARGFYDGTDDPYEVERIERGNRFEDKLAMYRNEY